MAFDLTDEELKATRIMNGTASKEELYERIAELEEIEKSHQKENGELRERLNNEIENHKVLSLDIAQACVDLGLPEDTIIADELVLEIKKKYIPKSKIKEVLEQRLKKYQDADDGVYKQDYLTRGELELVDRYKECSELLKILCEEDIYKIKFDYILKSKVKEKIEKINNNTWHDGYLSRFDRYAIANLEELLEERN